MKSKIRKQALGAAIFLVIGGSASLATAAPSDVRLYRYYDDGHRPVVTDNVTFEHITHGYEELNSSMQVLRKVAAQRPLSAEEQVAAKAKRDADAQRKRDDEQLLRLYNAASDAETARDRQIETLQVRIDFANSALIGQRQRRDADAQKATRFERTGKPVPADLKESIAVTDREIKDSLNTITTRKAEQEKIRKEFAVIIERLEFLKGKPSSTTSTESSSSGK
jgi:hypothetical protein